MLCRIEHGVVYFVEVALLNSFSINMNRIHKAVPLLGVPQLASKGYEVRQVLLKLVSTPTAACKSMCRSNGRS